MDQISYRNYEPTTWLSTTEVEFSNPTINTKSLERLLWLKYHSHGRNNHSNGNALNFTNYNSLDNINNNFNNNTNNNSNIINNNNNDNNNNKFYYILLIQVMKIGLL